MISRRTEVFKQLLSALPLDVQRQAREAYRHFRENPSHPGLHFKRVHPKDDIWSARVTDDYRAVGAKAGDKIIWFWIGKHSDYDRLLRKWKK